MEHYHLIDTRKVPPSFRRQHPGVARITSAREACKCYLKGTIRRPALLTRRRQRIKAGSKLPCQLRMNSASLRLSDFARGFPFRGTAIAPKRCRCMCSYERSIAYLPICVAWSLRLFSTSRPVCVTALQPSADAIRAHGQVSQKVACLPMHGVGRLRRKLKESATMLPLLSNSALASFSSDNNSKSCTALA
eukprot:6189058-Pleurochrysis_carterae.AAC.3